MAGMSCNQARYEMCLRVGQDVDGPGQRVLERHRTECTECHEYWRRLQSSHEVLQGCPALSLERGESLWPEIRQELQHSQPLPEDRGWARTLSGTALLAASLLIGVWVLQGPAPETQPANSPIRVMPAANPLLPRGMFPLPSDSDLLLNQDPEGRHSKKPSRKKSRLERWQEPDLPAPGWELPRL